jgi:hypothetical protein
MRQSAGFMGGSGLSSIFVGIAVLLLILEMSAFAIMLWKSMGQEPYGRCPRFRRAIRIAPE